MKISEYKWHWVKISENKWNACIFDFRLNNRIGLQQPPNDLRWRWLLPRNSWRNRYLKIMVDVTESSSKRRFHTFQELSFAGTFLDRNHPFQELSFAGTFLDRNHPFQKNSPLLEPSFTGIMAFRHSPLLGTFLYRNHSFQEPSFAGIFLYRNHPFQELAFTGTFLYRSHPFQESCKGKFQLRKGPKTDPTLSL